MRMVAPSKVPTTCDQLFTPSAGPSTVRSGPAASLELAASPRRQHPLGRSARSPAVPPASSTPSAQLTVCPWVLQLPWLTVAAPALSAAARVTTSVAPVARAGPLLVSAYWYV